MKDDPAEQIAVSAEVRPRKWRRRLGPTSALTSTPASTPLAITSSSSRSTVSRTVRLVSDLNTSVEKRGLVWRSDCKMLCSVVAPCEHHGELCLLYFEPDLSDVLPLPHALK